eukprot:gnl/Dysnectes_brevis/476_a529_5786.p1 GENE.gnl/Dysnectes_brevis/476_a529_5786~~gnl/Dysnectes_brevis/476_a529_5786.p1  ORF type:complete len:273 (-),score=27.93 gnl/Dysnectes_brevis/476_a529_5786:55-873(-)
MNPQETTSTLPPVRVSPLVLLSSIKRHVRRPSTQSRSIGALMGQIYSDGSYEVSNIFPMVHTDVDDQDPSVKMSISTRHFRKMETLLQKTYPSQKVIGWFSTGNNEKWDDSVIHWQMLTGALKKKEMVHICISPRDLTADGVIDIQVFYVRKSDREAQAVTLVPTTHTLISSEPEKMALRLVQEQVLHTEPVAVAHTLPRLVISATEALKTIDRDSPEGKHLCQQLLAAMFELTPLAMAGAGKVSSALSVEADRGLRICSRFSEREHASQSK